MNTDKREPKVGEMVIYKGRRDMIICTDAGQIRIMDTKIADKGLVGDSQFFVWSEEEQAWVIRPPV
jgi:hypothetical protein